MERWSFFFFQAEDGIRDGRVTGVQTCALPILPGMRTRGRGRLLFVSSILGRVAVPLSGAYAASKWALEALAETLASEAGHFGIHVTLLQAGAVSSGGIERAPTLLTDDDPYLPLADQLAAVWGTFITVEEVAAAVADVLEDPDPPLRVPVGRPAETVLVARRVAVDDMPFRIAPLRW